MSQTTHKEMREVTVAGPVLCDLCGEKCPRSGTHDEITVEHRHAYAYENDDDVEDADLCMRCWLGKVRPALVALGVKFTVRP